jgi:hypothetical protein
MWGREIEWSPNMDVDAVPDDGLAAFVRKVVNPSFRRSMSSTPLHRDSKFIPAMETWKCPLRARRCNGAHCAISKNTSVNSWQSL